MPGTSAEQPAAEAERSVEKLMEEVMEEPTMEEKNDEPEEESINEYFRKYILTGKGNSPEDKIQEACKEINYRNLVILIAVRDYVINQAKNIKEVAKKWELSFSTIQWVMSRKREHSVNGRQYTKRKKVAEKQGGPAKKSKWIEEKCTTNQLKSEAHSLRSQPKTLQIVQNYCTYPGYTPKVKRRVIMLTEH